MKTNVKLEILRVVFEETNAPSDEIVDLLNALHGRGFYNVLYVSTGHWDMDCIPIIGPMIHPVLVDLNILVFVNV